MPGRFVNNCIRYSGGSIATPITLTGTDSIRSYDLDDLGNWSSTTYTPAGGSPTTETRQHNLLNQVTQVDSTALSYDANGNLTDDGTRLCRYDALNRLKQVLRKSGNVLVAEYTYDALGRRIRKIVSNGGLGGTIPDGTTDYLYIDQQCVEQRDGSDAVTRQFVWGVYIDGLIQLKTHVTIGQQNLPAGAYWPMQDLHYRVTALSDSSGAIGEAYDHDPYGRRLAFVGPGTDGLWFSDDDLPASYAACQYGHQGLPHDEESGLVYNRNRMLHPGLGRFMQRDPLDKNEPGGGYQDGMSLYEYLRGDPIRYTDVMGTHTPHNIVPPPAPPGWVGQNPSNDDWMHCYIGCMLGPGLGDIAGVGHELWQTGAGGDPVCVMSGIRCWGLAVHTPFFPSRGEHAHTGA